MSNFYFVDELYCQVCHRSLIIWLKSRHRYSIYSGTDGYKVTCAFCYKKHAGDKRKEFMPATGQPTTNNKHKRRIRYLKANGKLKRKPLEEINTRKLIQLKNRFIKKLKNHGPNNNKNISILKQIAAELETRIDINV